MQLKRYTNQQLIEICTNIFYDYMTNSCETFYDQFDWKQIEDTPVDEIHRKLRNLVERDRETIKLQTEILQNYKCTLQSASKLKERIKFLQHEVDILSNSNMKTQKRCYADNGRMDYSRTAVRIPLDKKINSYYDDLVLEVLFYDDVCTLGGKFDMYKSLERKEDQIKFLKENTEITHLGLSYFNNGVHVLTIGLLGELHFNNPKIDGGRVLLLKPIFSDFENLTLVDTMKIINNDIRQYIQSKIDLDKENFTKVAEKEIRGDVYGIYNSPYGDEQYIRYVCPSTGRPYYNLLNMRNLQLSDYYEEGNPESYIDAWWNINTLGGEVTGEPILRC